MLVVDDDPAVLRAFVRLTRELPLDLVTALSAEQGLLVLDKQRVDVVVSDYQMLGMDGVTFLRLVGERYPGVRRVLHTGTTATPSLGSGIEALPKPCEPAELARLLGVGATSSGR